MIKSNLSKKKKQKTKIKVISVSGVALCRSFRSHYFLAAKKVALNTNMNCPSQISLNTPVQYLMKSLQIPLNSLSVLFNTMKPGSFWKAVIMIDIICVTRA